MHLCFIIIILHWYQHWSSTIDWMPFNQNSYHYWWRSKFLCNIILFNTSVNIDLPSLKSRTGENLHCFNSNSRYIILCWPAYYSPKSQVFILGSTNQTKVLSSIRSVRTESLQWIHLVGYRVLVVYLKIFFQSSTTSSESISHTSSKSRYYN